VLQLYVWLLASDDAGTFALVSIAISALTTGYSSALIAFDFDLDVPHRKNQPSFYGLIPDDNALRTRAFTLMTLISTLHNISRNMGYALLATLARGKTVAVYFFGAEMVLYLIYKIVRRDLYWFPRIGGIKAILVAITARVCTKVIADFTGCIQFRHP